MRILLIRFSSLGDVVLATAVVEALSSSKDNELAFVVNEEYAPLLAANPNIKQIIPFDGNFKSLINRARKFDPEIVFDLHLKWRSIILAMKLGKKTIHTNKKVLERRAMVLFKHNRENWNSVVDFHLSALERANVPFKMNALPKLYVSESDKLEASPFLQMTKKPIVVIHSGAKHELKNWGEEKFVKTARYISDLGFDVLYFGKESPSFVTKVDNISLSGLKGILASAEIYIGNDSGPSHMASALGAATISIFGPTHPALGFAPRGEWARTIYADLPCSPCSLHGSGKCRYGNRECFEKISPEFVVEEAMKLWRKRTQEKQFSSIETEQS